MGWLMTDQVEGDIKSVATALYATGANPDDGVSYADLAVAAIEALEASRTAAAPAHKLPTEHPLRCASCGERATTTVILEGFRAPVCLRHYNIWRTPDFEAAPAHVEGLRAAWERAVLTECVANMPATGEAPDFLHVVSTAMLTTRAAAPARQPAADVVERVLADHQLVWENDGGDYGGRSWFECSCDTDEVIRPTEYATEAEHRTHVAEELTAALTAPTAPTEDGGES